MYIHEAADWPQFHWKTAKLALPLASVRHRQGRLIGHMEARGLNLQQETVLQTLTADVLKSSEIEGEKFDATRHYDLPFCLMNLDNLAVTRGDNLLA